MTPRTGFDGQKCEPQGPLVAAPALQVGQYVPFTDGTARQVQKAEQTIHTDSYRVMVTTTILFEEAEGRWLEGDAQEHVQP